MRKMKTFLAALLSVCMLLSLAACGGGSQSSSAPAASSDAAASVDTAAEASDLPEMKFTIASSASSTNEMYNIQVTAAEDATATSGGKLNFDVIWDGTLGSDSELIENCMTGSIPIISVASSPFLPYIPEIAVFDMPAVYSGSEAAYAGISQFTDSFNDIFREKNLHILGMGFSNFRGLSTNTNIQTAGDFKGMKIRTMENKYHMAFWTNLGSSPTPLAFSELYLALQQGLVDAQDNPATAVYASKFYEVQDYFMPVTAFPFVNIIAMNKDTYDALPAEYQTILTDFAGDFLYKNYEADEQIQADAITNMGDGITILPYTDEIQAAMKTAAEPVYEQIAADIGSDITEAYLATAG